MGNGSTKIIIIKKKESMSGALNFGSLNALFIG